MQVTIRPVLSSNYKSVSQSQPTSTSSPTNQERTGKGDNGKDSEIQYPLESEPFN